MKKQKVHTARKSKGSQYYGLLGKREENQVKLLKLLSQYLTIKKIAEITNKSKRQVYKSFKVYQKNGLINEDRSLTREGSQKVHIASRYTAKSSLKPNTIRLNDLRFKVKVYSKIWNEKRNKLLELKNISSKSIDMGFWISEQIVIDKFTIHLNPQHIIFIMPSYYGETPFEAFSKALEDLKLLCNKLQRLLCIRLFNTKYLDFEITRQHYALIKNELAQDYNKKHKKLFVYDDLGILRLLIDDSYNLGEFEAVNKDTSMPDSEKTQRFWKEVIEKDILLSTLENNIKDTKRNLRKVSEEQVNASMVLDQISNNIIKLTETMNYVVKRL
jgi:predicted transcriptional regulator